ncbi:MAG: ECF transporter S component [Prevotella sp.]|nr:ECF transporter S component [Prevotella sp.]MBQ8116012.1 ECF transporter S component [Prevotella sp.]
MQHANYKTLSLTNHSTYIFSAMFVIGNILLPQLCHLVPQGGLMLLPIYFFTLVGAYCYGINLGLLTAVLSPVVNSMLFGMPPAAALPAILVKSVSLAVVASYVAHRSQRVSLGLLALVVVAYQLVGMAFEYVYTGSLYAALQDVRLGIPGLLMQVLLGYVFIKKISK